MRATILTALELLSSLRLCSNVPGQWAVQTALGGYQSIRELIAPGGRLYESRRAILEAVSRSRFLAAHGADGRDVRVHRRDARTGCRTSTISSSRWICSSRSTCCSRRASSFNVPYRNHFRITNLPEPRLLDDVFARIEELLDSYAAAERPAVGHAPELRVVDRTR